MLKQLLFFVTLAIAYVQASDHHGTQPVDGWVPIFHRSDAPSDWTTVDVAPAGDNVKFMVALKQRNLDVLNAKYEAVTDPASKEWTQFLSAEEITNLVRPLQKDHDRVVDWFTTRGAAVKSFGDAIEVTASVAEAETFFNTKMHVYAHRDGRKIVRQRGKAHLHGDISEDIDIVEGLYNFPVPHFGWKSGAHAVADAQGGAARGLKQFGSTTGYVPQSTDNLYHKGRLETPESGSQGVIEFQGQSYDPAALQSFAKQVNLPISDDTVVVGPNSPSSPGTEATLDIQWMAGTNNGAKNWFWLEAGNDWLLTFATHFFNTKNVPDINSISYGWAEDAQCTVAGEACSNLGVNSQGYVKRVNTEFQKIGLRGIALMAASGDSGANGRSDPSCSQQKLEPGFPGASPFVTTVGATQINNPETSLQNPPPACTTGSFNCVSGGGTEAAVSYKVANFASGGGFSNYSPRPSYQDKVVEAYMASDGPKPPATFFNSKNRGYPDVASIGTGIIIYSNGLQAVGGTSASCPTVAGIMGLLNSHKLKKTGSPLGPLNPFLYGMYDKAPQCFNDVTTGDNKCTEQGCGIFGSCKGYTAVKGWDPVTGLGSVNYDCMVKYLDMLIEAKGM